MSPRPLPFFSSHPCHRQVGGQVCPLIQNDNLPPDPVAWRHRFARLDRAEAAACLPSKGQTRTPYSGAVTGVRVSQRIVKLFVYGRSSFTFIRCHRKGNLQLGAEGGGRQWIKKPSESLSGIILSGPLLCHTKSKKDHFTQIYHRVLHLYPSLYSSFIICSSCTLGDRTSQCYESLSTEYVLLLLQSWRRNQRRQWRQLLGMMEIVLVFLQIRVLLQIPLFWSFQIGG